METTNVRAEPSTHPSTPSPWWLFGTVIVVAWAALVRHHLTTDRHSNEFTVVFGMWALMTVAMMAPTAIPMLASLRNVLRSGSITPWWMFLGGYVTVWLGFAFTAAATQQWLVQFGILGHDGAATSRWLTAALLAAAGVYQFSPLKQRCQRECLSPMLYFLRHWRDGAVGGAQMGLRHGRSCLGCCWALMLLAFVGGVANIGLMVLCAALMALEKVPRLGQRLTVPLGFTLIAASLVVAAGIGVGSDPRPAHQHTITIYEREPHGHLVNRG